MWKTICIAALLALPVLAQPPRNFFPWWDSPLAKDLNLSEDQNKQIRAVVKEYRTKLIDVRASVEKAEAELEDQFNEDYFDQNRANQAVEKVVAARGDMTRAMSQMGLKLRAVLTPDQYRELQKRRPKMQPGQMGPMMMRDQQQQRRRGPGPQGQPGGQPGQGQPPQGGPPPPQQ